MLWRGSRADCGDYSIVGLLTLALSAGGSLVLALPTPHLVCGLSVGWLGFGFHRRGLLQVLALPRRPSPVRLLSIDLLIRFGLRVGLLSVDSLRIGPLGLGLVSSLALAPAA